MLILDSVLWGGGGGGAAYVGGKFDAFFNVFCISGVFLGGGEFGILGESPQEIAGNNTVLCLISDSTIYFSMRI